MRPHYYAFKNHRDQSQPIAVGLTPEGWKYPVLPNEQRIAHWMLENKIERVCRADWEDDQLCRVGQVWWQFNGQVYTTDLELIQELPGDVEVFFVMPGWTNVWQRGITINLFDRQFAIDSHGGKMVSWDCVFPVDPSSRLDVFKPLQLSSRRVS